MPGDTTDGEPAGAVDRNAGLKALLVASEKGRAPGVKAGRVIIPKNAAHRAQRERRANDPTYKGPGGWMGGQGSLDALDVHRWRTTVEHLRKCVVCKNGVALRNSDRCRHHHPAQVAANRRQDPAWRPRRTTIIRRELRKLIKANAVPRELIAQEAFQAAYAEATAPWTELDGRTHNYGGVGAFRRDCWLLLAELIHAWTILDEHNDPRPWVECIRKARERGLLA